MRSILYTFHIVFANVVCAIYVMYSGHRTRYVHSTQTQTFVNTNKTSNRIRFANKNVALSTFSFHFLFN